MTHIPALLLALAATSASAIVPAEPVPAPAPTPVAAPAAVPAPGPISAAAGAAAAAGSQSGASTGPVSATGGSTGAVTAAGGASGPVTVGGDSSSSSTRALAFGFPSIHFGSASASECLVAGPQGTAMGWNFAAGTKPAVVEAQVCNLRALAREAASQCQWRTAASMRAEAARRLGAEPPPIPESLQDADPMSCVVVQQPTPVVAPAPVQPVSVVVMNELEQAAASTPAVTPRRPAKAKPSPCPPGQRAVQVCEAVR